MLLSLPLQAWDFCEPLGVTAEARVAYYSPSSKRVRKIYSDGWADYQLELSKGFKCSNIMSSLGSLGCGSCGDCGGCGDGCGSSLFSGCADMMNEMEVKAWIGVSGFSRKGASYTSSYGGASYGSDHERDKTKIELIPISFGLKFFYPLGCSTKVFVGGAACYSFLHIHDESRFVRRHTHKERWGGLIQSGLTYDFCEWGVVSLFADYLFQEFKFHNENLSSYSGGYDEGSRHIERHKLDMSGYKIGVGLGVTF